MEVTAPCSTRHSRWGGGGSPGPDAGGREQLLGVGCLVAVETEEVASAKAAHQHADHVEAAGTDGEVAGPPGADGQEDQQVDTGEGRGLGDTYREAGHSHLVLLGWALLQGTCLPTRHHGHPGVPAKASSTMARNRAAATSSQWAVTRKRAASLDLRLGAGAWASGELTAVPGATSLSSSSCGDHGVGASHTDHGSDTASDGD
ncbi:PREDICTED: uncharacterized protein LOC102857277 [Elephantulus edwardii]|uniref:uncharacterized protein LOC102857277 n=1 Tax=Elephantulus edwardii TaxID=28737 RepID=UPI0003F0E367|nr:PREDICTED: uncharacterized protein LOC102857277 [Elephantulus edwardii]